MRNIFSPYLNHKQIFRFVETVDEHVESWLLSLLSLDWQNEFLDFLWEENTPETPEAISSLKKNVNKLDNQAYAGLLWSVINLERDAECKQGITFCYQSSQKESIKKNLLEALLNGESSFENACERLWNGMIRRDSLVAYLQDMRSSLVFDCARQYFEKESIAEFLQIQELDRYYITADAIGFAVPAATAAKPPRELYAKRLEKYFKQFYSPISIMKFLEERIMTVLSELGYFGFNEVGYPAQIIQGWNQFLIRFFKHDRIKESLYVYSPNENDIVDVHRNSLRSALFFLLKDEKIINERLSYERLTKCIQHPAELAYCIKTQTVESMASYTYESLLYADLNCHNLMGQMLSWDARLSILKDIGQANAQQIHRYFDEFIVNMLDNHSLGAEEQHHLIMQTGYLHGLQNESPQNQRIMKYIDSAFIDKIFTISDLTILPVMGYIIRAIYDSSTENRAILSNYTKNITTSAEYVESLYKGPHFYALLLELIHDILDLEHVVILFEREVIRSAFGERDNIFFHTIQFYPALVETVIAQFKKLAMTTQLTLMREYSRKMKNMISVTIWSCPEQLSSVMEYLYQLADEALVHELFDQSVLNSALRISIEGACVLLSYLKRHDVEFIQSRLSNAHELIRERLLEGDVKNHGQFTNRLVSVFRRIDPSFSICSLAQHYQLQSSQSIEMQHVTQSLSSTNEMRRRKNLYDVVLYEIRGQLHAKKKLSYNDPQFIKIRKKLVKLLHEADGAKGSPEDVIGYIDEILKSTSVKPEVNNLTLIEAFVCEPVEANMLTTRTEPNLLIAVLLHNQALFVPLLNKIASQSLIYRLFTERDQSGHHLLSLALGLESPLMVLNCIFEKLALLSAQQLLDIFSARSPSAELLIVNSFNSTASMISKRAVVLSNLIHFMVTKNLSISFEILSMQHTQGLNSLTLGLLYQINLAEMIVDSIDKHQLSPEQWFALFSQPCHVKQSHMNGANALMIMVLRTPHLVMKMVPHLKHLPLGLSIYLLYQRNDELENVVMLVLKYAPLIADAFVSLIVEILSAEQYTKLFTTVNFQGVSALSIAAKQDTSLFFKLIDMIKPEIDLERKKQLFAEVLLSDTQHTQQSIDAIVQRLPNTRADIVQILLSQEPNLLFLAMSSNPSLIAPMKDYMMVLSADKQFAKYIPDFMMSQGLGYNVLLEAVKYAPDCVADLIDLLAKVPAEKLISILNVFDERGMSIFMHVVADGQEHNFELLLKLLRRLPDDTRKALVNTLRSDTQHTCLERILRLPIHENLYKVYQQKP